MTNSVLKPWVFDLPHRMQSVLMSALRGCDTARKDDHSKFITRALRGVVLNNADPSNTFITDCGIPDPKIASAFLWDLDAYPLHFIMHTTHAAEIIGYKHPDENLRKWWLGFYKKIVKGLHLNFETEKQLGVRLGLTDNELAEDAARRLLATKKVRKPRWDAGTGTSHGGRNRSYSGSS